MDHGAFRSFEISASGLTAQRRRLDAIAENIANAQTTRSADGGPYKRREVTFSAAPTVAAARRIAGGGEGLALAATGEGHRTASHFEETPSWETGGDVQVTETRVAGSRLVYDPGHPDADEKGMVAYPDVSVVQEMIEMILASRAYEANVTAIQSAKALFQSALEI